MSAKLLVALEVFEFLKPLPRRQRERLWERFLQIRDHPEALSDATRVDSNSRLIDINDFGKFEIHYWNDVGDRHVKILELHPIDPIRSRN